MAWRCVQWATILSWRYQLDWNLIPFLSPVAFCVIIDRPLVRVRHLGSPGLTEGSMLASGRGEPRGGVSPHKNLEYYRFLLLPPILHVRLVERNQLTAIATLLDLLMSWMNPDYVGTM